ncbi:hypothetical protein SO802_006330 [Lithocarpus litseifolius]|uniref:RNase H type-1 domain-containing protein n=1 Tax=Lithocarpus litseifolius TaxID=425828 RepID=A0AAW2DN48_9ROSI
MDFLWFVLMKEKWMKEKSALAVTLVWALWTNRNDVWHGGSRKNGQQLFQWCSRYLNEFWAFSVVHPKSSQTCDSKWTPPIALAYKELLKLRLKHLNWVCCLQRKLVFLDFVLEGDSLIIVQSLCENAPAPSMASVLYGILVASLEFRNVHFSHVRWQGNRPAHLLAKFALGIYDYLAWIEENPCFLEHTLLHDVSCALI